MIGGGVAKRYARAIYELADDHNAVDRIGDELDNLAGIWDGSEELRDVFESPRFGMDQKRGIVKAIAERIGAHDLLRNTVQMLSDRGRLKYLPEIAQVYARLSERKSGRVRAEIVTAVKLPERYYEELEKTLNAATGRQVVLVRREDPSLIGGVVTTVGGRVFDGSIKNRLRGLRSQLLASTEPVALATKN